MPAPVVRRLPQYLGYVQDRTASGAEYVSSQEFAHSLGLTPSTVRQDFTHLGITGIPRKGYEVGRLERVLAELLGVDGEKRIAIVGAGNLGRALALHGNLAKYGFRVCAVFDVDPVVIGTTVGTLRVQSMDALVDVVHRDRIQIGVITVPSPAAQRVADLLIASGVQGLLNLSLTRVVTPRWVFIVDSRFVLDLLVLSHGLLHSVEHRLPPGAKHGRG